VNKFDLFSIIGITLIATLAYSAEVKFTAEKIIPFIGGSDYNRDNLQKSGLVKVDQIGAYYFFGEGKGLYLGLINSSEKAEYTQFESNARPYGHFSSSFSSLGTDFGLWVQPSDILRIEGGLGISQGTFEISDSSSTISKQPNTKKLDVHFSFIYPTNFLSPDVNIDLFVKLGYYKVFISDFNYNGVSYSAPEINLKTYLYLSFGVGVRF
tara:strand:+ start:7442 stop:8071 length:630 start_codon:yes stop_codon:yes gene_type:complete